MEHDSGWDANRLYIIEEIKRISAKIDILTEEIVRQQIENATMKVKIGVIGGLGALVPIVLKLVIEYMATRH